MKLQYNKVFFKYLHTTLTPKLPQFLFPYHQHMSSLSSKFSPPPPIIPPLHLESTSNIHVNSNVSSNANNSHPILNPQNGNQTPTITFRQVLHYWWEPDEYQRNNSNHNINNASPTPPQIWLAQNVFPLVTPMRIICFFLSQISFFLAYGFYMQTYHYKAHVASGGPHHALILFVAANIGNSVFLSLLLFFGLIFSSAYERYLQHYLLKSIGEVMVMLLMSLVILGIGHMHHHHHQEGHSSDIAGFVTCGFLTIYSLCIVILLKPGHHYSLLDASATLTLHIGLMGIYGIPAVFFIFLILLIKNYLWSHIDHAQGPSNEAHRLVWSA